MEEQEKFEKAQKLSEKSGATFEDAKTALENCNWDMLDAMVLLEKNGKAGADKRNAEYSSNANSAGTDTQDKKYESSTSKSFGETVGKAIGWIGDLIKKGMDNYFVVRKDSQEPFHVPITIFILILIFLNWFALVLLVVGLFFGFKYSFEGQNISKMNTDKVNSVLSSATDKAQQIKEDVKEGYSNHKE